MSLVCNALDFMTTFVCVFSDRCCFYRSFPTVTERLVRIWYDICQADRQVAFTGSLLRNASLRHGFGLFYKLMPQISWSRARIRNLLHTLYTYTVQFLIQQAYLSSCSGSTQQVISVTADILPNGSTIFLISICIYAILNNLCKLLLYRTQ